MRNKCTPDIRFSGFTGDWEQCNLGNISTKIGSGKTPKGGDKNYKSEGIPLLRSQNIFNDKVNFNDVVYITPEIDENMANSRVQKGDVLINITGASIGRSAVYKLNKKANVNQHVSIIRPFSEVNPYFIQLNITSEKGQKQIELNQAGGGREGLNFQQIAKISFYFPCSLEQDKLGHFFIQLDNTIALHQQELNILKQTKQGFMQKMFPKEGDSVPEVRFPGFTGDWEQRTLGKHAEILTGGTPKTQIKEYWEPKEIPWMSSGEVNKKRLLSTDNRISTLGFENSSARWVKENSVLIALAGQGKTRGQVAINEIPITTNQSIAAIVPKGELHYEFIFQNLEKRYEELRLISSGDGTRGGLNKQLISDVEILSPSIEEQIVIGNFFKKLDDTIALYQRELDALKETKKAFLQKMFV
ncbi:restriction endonuclease subunit S [Priestia megaterium]|uniref:restriction endonuclease subunit S n=1 Tax=Priestia megaterium TaxID=1404 RepID=UPI000BF8FF9C|nr:restriction endonuclease subunit S [Priestia megaterium]PFJ96335.1 restriction endonuclease subunit S [Priestia megaterium]